MKLPLLLVLVLLFLSSSCNTSAQPLPCGNRCKTKADCPGQNLVCTPNKVCDGDPALSPVPCPMRGCEATKTFTYSNATAHDPEYCVNGTTYQYFTCSPSLEARNFAALYFIELEGFSPACSGLDKTRTYNNSEHLASMATGWFQNHSSCFKEIVITSDQGMSVTATVVDECSSTMGCVPETGYYEPCTPKSIGGTRGVWEALGQQNMDRVLSVTWTWKKDEAGWGKGRIISAAASCGIIVVLAVLALLWWKFLRPQASYISKQQQQLTLDDLKDMPRQMRYRELFRATKGFTTKIGEGGFGTVFKGMLATGEHVAVKKISGGSRHGDKQFKAEVMSIGSIHHLYLVKLVGFCLHSPNNLLVYEFVSNGSLDRWIVSKERFLSWANRISIALDVARGLAYLHDGCRDKVLHLDIKPQNILLDDNLNAKIADFGFSKLVDKDKTHVVTVMRGTVGYMAPEWLHSRVTDRTDVYSFGIVLLELACGRKAIEYPSDASADVFFLGQTAFAKLDSGNSTDLVDEQLHGDESFSMGGFENIVRVGLWCAQEDPMQRPSMSMVVKLLEGAANVSEFPLLETPVTQALSLLVSSGNSSGSQVSQISISVSDLAR